ncbi:hypothetical protein [Mycobacterium colombiense]
MADALHLDLPGVQWPLYWELEVSNYSIWVSLKKRPFRLWRNAITPIARDLVSHQGALTQAILDQVSATAHAIIAQATPAERVHASLVNLVDSRTVKVVLDR